MSSHQGQYYGYLCGDQILMIRFPNREVYQRWIGAVEGIKAHIGGISRRRMARARFGGDDPEIEKDAYVRWLQVVYQFRVAAGDDLVPWDIKEAVNSVEEGVGAPKTNWKGAKTGCGSKK